MPDRHLTKPKAVRMPGGLLAWYETYAAANDTNVNAAMVRALEEFRDHADQGAARYSFTRAELIDAIACCKVNVKTSGAAAGMISADSMADAIIAVRGS